MHSRPTKIVPVCAYTGQVCVRNGGIEGGGGVLMAWDSVRALMGVSITGRRALEDPDGEGAHELPAMGGMGKRD